METSRSRGNLYKSYDEEEELAKKRNVREKTVRFLKKNYPPFLIGAVITAATVFAASYRHRPDQEALSVSLSNILGDRSGSVSAISTTSAAGRGGYVSVGPTNMAISSSKPASRVFPININTADIATLDALPDIGPARAKDIIEYRQRFGPFKDIKELMRVKGIKESRFGKIKDLVTVGDQK